MRWLYVSLRIEYFEQQRAKSKGGMTELDAQSYV